MNSYFVIGCSADGLTFSGPLSKEELERRIESGYYGDSRKNFVTETPRTDGFALEMQEDELFIIQGKAVKPRPKESITRWEVP